MKALIASVLRTGSGSILTLVIGAVIVKTVSVIDGIAGVGMWSMIKQLQQGGVLLSTANGNSALVRGIAGKHSDEKYVFSRTVLTLFFVLGLFITTLFVVFSFEISAWLKNVPRSVVMFMAIPIWFGIARSYVQGCLNGFRKIGQLAISQVIGVSAGALVAYPLATWAKNGEPVALVLLASVTAAGSFLSALYFLKKNTDFFPNVYKAPKWKSSSAKEFWSIAGALSVTALGGIISLIIIKAIILRNSGLEGVGLFDASWSLGTMYVTVLLGSFGTYVLPKLSSLGEGNQSAFVYQVIKLATLLSIPLIVLAISVKPIVIQVFYSGDFLPTLKMFRWMLIGDYLKLTSWVFAMVLISNKYIGILVASSLLWDIALIATTVFSYRYGLGLELLGTSIMVLNALTFLFYMVWLSKKMEIIIYLRLRLTWIAGLAIIMLSSKISWDLQSVRWGETLLVFSVACVVSFAGLDVHDKAAISQFFKRSATK